MTTLSTTAVEKTFLRKKVHKLTQFYTSPKKHADYQSLKNPIPVYTPVHN